MPLDAHQLASRIAPKLVEQLEAHKSEIVADAGGMLARGILRAAWPRLVAEIPAFIEIGIEAMAEEFGHLTLEEIAASIFAIRQNATARHFAG